MKEYTKETVVRTVSSINKNILLPDIQRPFVWEEEQIYKLFDSLMRGYPINTFLYWDLTKEKLNEMEKRDVVKIKMFKFVDSNTRESEEETSRDKDRYSLVLDGQQRLTSLFISLKGIWIDEGKKAKVEKELYFDVLSGSIENEDGIQYEFRFLDRKNNMAFLEKIEADKKVAQNKLWVNVKKMFERDMGQTKNRRLFVKEILDAAPGLIDQEGWVADNIDNLNDVLKEDGIINFFPEDENQYDKVLDIFIRTNSGGTKLGYSDLLFSKIKLGWIDAREKFKHLLDEITGKNNYEFDTDFILKICLVLNCKKAEEIRYSITNVNESFINWMKSNWEKIERSTTITVDLLNKFLINDEKLLPSYNALIPIVYWVFKNEKKGYRSDSANDIAELSMMRTWLVKALLSGMFGGQADTVLYKCKESTDKTSEKIFPSEEIQKNIETMKNRNMNISDAKIDQFKYGSKESHLFLSLCYKSAINFNPIMKGNFPEQDHIFSKHELEKAGVVKEKINSIYNIRYVSLTDNRTKGKDTFDEWVEKLGDNKKKVFETHSIPDGEWNVSNFDNFLNVRKSIMLKALIY